MKGIISVRLLGTVEVERDGEPVGGFRSRKALALLGYLAVQSQPVPRERLADLFWEDKSETRGRANLNWVLHRITTLLPNYLRTDRHTVGFQCSPSYWLDTVAFEDLEAQGGTAALAAAVALYRGQFLEGVSLRGCTEFELWLVGERERWHRRVAGVLERLVAYHGQCGAYEAGVRFARQLLALEPWREEVYRQVMRLLAWNGQRGAALAQYEACRQALVDELDVEPAAETTQLYEQIRAGELETPAPLDLTVQPPSFLEEEGKEAVEDAAVFVAREQELARLDGFLDGALGGEAKVVFVTGEAGQGKTMLLQRFVRRSLQAYPDLVVAGGNGNAYTGVGDPFLPFREMLSLLTGDVEAAWAARAIPREQARRLWHLLPLAAQALMQEGPELIGTLLPGPALLARARACAAGSVDWLARLEELVGRLASIPGNPSLQQSDLFEQYTRVLRMLAQQRPLLLVLDDLQWADASSAGLLFHLGRRIEGSRVLIVSAYRPTEMALGYLPSPPSAGGAEGGRQPHPLVPIITEFKRRFGESEIDLEQTDGRWFVDAFLDEVPNRLSESFREMLTRQTGGHPLFTSELLRGMQERGDLAQDGEGRWVEGAALDWETLPPRVEAVIAARIERLPQPLRQAVEVAGVEGETFTAEVVAQALAIDAQEMVKRLSEELDRRHRLVRAQGLQRVGTDRLSTYRFRHILFQRYLYNSLDPVERAQLHEAVGTALEVLCEGAEVAPQLARHFEEAGIVEKAVEYLRQVGERATRMAAHEEAIAHFRRGLALLEGWPENGDKGGRSTPECSMERNQAELMLQVGLAAPLQVVEGFTAPELDDIYTRARELCRRLGDTPQLLSVLCPLVIVYGNRAEHQAACEIAERILVLAEQVGDPASVVLAHYGVGWNLMFMGELDQARVRLEQSAAGYDPQQHYYYLLLSGHDVGAGTLLHLSWALWFLGYPDQARDRVEEALTLAGELVHLPTLALAQGLGCVLHVYRNDVQSTEALVDACIDLSIEQGFPYWLNMGTTFRGWALARQGRTEEGCALLRQADVEAQAMGIGVGHPHRLTLLAEAYGNAGRAEEGLPLLAEALDASRRTGECVYDAEIHRVKGELLLLQGAEAGAEASFQRAIEVARGQNAKSWELRATTSLCRLWQKQEKREEAHQQLAAVYGWFSEGFDTADLKEAKALIEELS
jgi:DNA-binding SARP family transcriptional activator/predicted ATPase